MLVPDFARAYYALDAHERPLLTFKEICPDTDYCTLRGVALALAAMVGNGTVWMVWNQRGPVRYALVRRLRFRHALREQGIYEGPWAS